MSNKYERKLRLRTSTDIDTLCGANVSGLDIARNYASVYKTTGGGVRTDKAYKFVSKFLDNRVLDLYLKYLGITVLTPSTLVPLTLILGQEAFKQSLKYMKRQEQKGGSIPVLDNKLVGTYLKIAGLTQLSLSLHTLVPLGLAMAIYKTFYNEGKRKDNEGKRKDNEGKRKDNEKKTGRQEGGNLSKLFIKSNVSPGYLQLGNRYWNGQTVANNIGSPLSSWQQAHRPMSYINHELQLPCNGSSCGTDTLVSPPPIGQILVDVQGIQGVQDITPDVAGQQAQSTLGTGDWALSSSGDSEVQMTGVDTADYVMRNQMAGSRRRGHYKKERSPKRGSPKRGR